jgi:hypothetical protein
MTGEQMQQFMARVRVLEEELKSTGSWVFGGRLHEPGPPPSGACPTARC